MRGSGGVSEARRDEIRRVAAEMGYEPRVAAQLLRGNRTGQLGLLVSGLTMQASETGFTGPLIGHFVHTCEFLGVPYHIEMCSDSDSDESSFVPPRQLAGRLVDGTIIGGAMSRLLIDWLEKQDRFPWVCIDEPATYSVHNAIGQGIAEAVTYLHGIGHRRIGFTGGPRYYSTHRHGYEGYLKALADLGLPAPPENWVMQNGLDGLPVDLNTLVPWFDAMFELPHRPTAMIAHGMRTARALIYAAMRRGIQIPEDLSVIAVGSEVDATACLPSLTSIEVDYRSMMQQAVSLLRDLIEGNKPGQWQYSFAPRLVHRHSTVPPGRP